jgi:hypothetical protein
MTEPNTANKTNIENPSTLYPSLNDIELTTFLTTLKDCGKKLDLQQSKDFLDWLHYLQNISMSNEEFNNLFYELKQVLHLVNRTAGLINAYAIGIGVGLFLGRPELLPSINIEPEETERECTMVGCDNPVFRDDLCSYHYKD